MSFPARKPGRSLRTIPMSLRIDREDKQLLDDAAFIEGKSRATWAYETLIREAKKLQPKIPLAQWKWPPRPSRPSRPHRENS